MSDEKSAKLEGVVKAAAVIMSPISSTARKLVEAEAARIESEANINNMTAAGMQLDNEHKQIRNEIDRENLEIRREEVRSMRLGNDRVEQQLLSGPSETSGDVSDSDNATDQE